MPRVLLRPAPWQLRCNAPCTDLRYRDRDTTQCALACVVVIAMPRKPLWLVVVSTLFTIGASSRRLRLSHHIYITPRHLLCCRGDVRVRETESFLTPNPSPLSVPTHYLEEELNVTTRCYCACFRAPIFSAQRGTIHTLAKKGHNDEEQVLCVNCCVLPPGSTRRTGVYTIMRKPCLLSVQRVAPRNRRSGFETVVATRGV
jgi:hypothetical protein